MAKTVLTDAGFLAGLLSEQDAHHCWALAQVPALPRPWVTCEPVLGEADHLLEQAGRAPRLRELLRRCVVTVAFDFDDNLETVLDLMDKYRDVPMSLSDACLVRMSEIMPDPILITTDSDFRIYRRHSRQVIPCLMP